MKNPQIQNGNISFSFNTLKLQKIKFNRKKPYSWIGKSTDMPRSTRNIGIF